LSREKPEVRAQGLEPWTYGLKVVREPAFVIPYAEKINKWQMPKSLKLFVSKSKVVTQPLFYQTETRGQLCH